MVNYRFISRSASDPRGDKGGLGYHTRAEAEHHKDVMNALIATYEDEVTVWNKEFWKQKPQSWFVVDKQEEK